MQNMKSLDNLIAKPVMGANDDIWAKVGKNCVDLYSYEEEMHDALMKVDEDHRKVLSRELLNPSKQD
jgi:hypothetical protein